MIFDYVSVKRVKKNEPIPLKKFDVNYELTDIESLNFIHQEATIRVKDTVADHYEISKKSFSLLLLMITISTFLVGFLMNKSINHKLRGIDVVAIIGLAICLFAIFVLWLMNRPITFRAPGRIPKKVMVKKIFEDIPEEDSMRLKFLKYQEILHCQVQIQHNQYYNTHRLSVIDFVIRIVMISFFALLAMTILLAII